MDNRLVHRSGYPLVRGEVWISSSVLLAAGLEDIPANHFRFAEQLGQQMVCFSVAEQAGLHQILGYRYFPPDSLPTAPHDRAVCTAAVIDGPFQRLVGKHGFMEVLLGWAQEPAAILAAGRQEADIALKLVQQCLDRNFNTIIIADDLAGSQAPLLRPSDMDRLCTPFYQQAITLIHQAGALALLHCCGQLQPLAVLLASWRFDGLAAVETGSHPLEFLDAQSSSLLMAGIDAPLLSTDCPSAPDIATLHNVTCHFAKQNRLLLSSNCGLYRPEFVPRLRRLYAELENLGG